MKKILYIFCLLICMLGLCGCQSSGEDEDVIEVEDKIMSALKEEKVISDSMKLIDTQTYYAGEWYENTYYIYEDSDSKMIAIEYVSYDCIECPVLVIIYYDVIINDDVNLLSSYSEPCYYYQNGEYTDNARYIIDEYGTKEKYCAISISTYYTLASTDDNECLS